MNDFSSYLGFMVLHKKKSAHYFSPLVVHSKLIAWKGRNLSMAKHITSGPIMPFQPSFYRVQATTLPISICNEIEKICRDFVWGSDMDNWKIHLMSWDYHYLSSPNLIPLTKTISFSPLSGTGMAPNTLELSFER